MKNINLEKRSVKSVFDTNTIKLIIVMAVIFITMSSLNPKMFFTKQNWTAMAFQIPELGFFALATSFVIISGGIDLSIVSIANVSGICAAFIMRDALARKVAGIELYLLILLVFIIGVAIGTILGAFNGLLVSRFKVSPILATLGTMNLFTGIGIIISHAEAISGFPEAYMEIGNGDVLGIPICLIMFICALIIAYIILNKTKYGFDLKFYGSNPKASLFTGIKNRNVILKTYILSGIISAIIGLEFISRTNSAKADYGSSYVFNAILCAILGGINPNGGEGRLSGVVLALVSLQLLSSGFNMLWITGTAKDLTGGLLLLVVMSANYIIQQKQLKKKTKNLG